MRNLFHASALAVILAAAALFATAPAHAASSLSGDVQTLCGGTCDKGDKDKDADKGDESWSSANGAQALCGGTCDKAKGDKEGDDKADETWSSANGAQALCGGTCDKGDKEKDGEKGDSES